eukprot:NODE_177_length_14091_cov_0.996141.p3 type:complete len:365 gc:universal NODE_177_length_14091_cov_0.996141:5890-6984(+)
MFSFFVSATVLINEWNSTFGPLLDGAAVSPSGDLWFTELQIANLDRKLELPGFNGKYQFAGMKWIDSESFYVIEVIQNIIYKSTNGIFTKFCQHPAKENGMSNDLVIYNDMIFITGQKYTPYTSIGDGMLWKCDSNGKSSIIETLGRTNGIALHPNNKDLFISEAFNSNNTPIINRIHKYSIIDNVPQNRQLVVDFEKLDQSGDTDIDGMRFDVENNLYVTRNGNGQIAIFDDKMRLKQHLNVSFQYPTNLEIVHNQLYVVGRCNGAFNTGKGCIDYFDVSIEGAIYSKLVTQQIEVPYSPYLGLIIGLAVGLFALILLVVVFVRKSFQFRKRQKQRSTGYLESPVDNEATMLPYVPKLHDISK